MFFILNKTSKVIIILGMGQANTVIKIIRE